MGLASLFSDLGKQCRPRSDAAARSVLLGSTLFAYRLSIKNKIKMKKAPDTPKVGKSLIQLLRMEKFTQHIWVNDSPERADSAAWTLDLAVLLLKFKKQKTWRVQYDTKSDGHEVKLSTDLLMPRLIWVLGTQVILLVLSWGNSVLLNLWAPIWDECRNWALLWTSGIKS